MNACVLAMYKYLKFSYTGGYLVKVRKQFSGGTQHIITHTYPARTKLSKFVVHTVTHAARKIYEHCFVSRSPILLSLLLLRCEVLTVILYNNRLASPVGTFPQSLRGILRTAPPLRQRTGGEGVRLLGLLTVASWQCLRLSKTSRPLVSGKFEHFGEEWQDISVQFIR